MLVPRVSIVMPVYNGAEFLRFAVDSVRAQTFPDWELVAVDDGSVDESGKMLAEASANDSRIKVIHQENGGCSEARNTGLAAARGEFIGFLDQDDLMHPEMLRLMVEALDSSGADAVEADYMRLFDEQKFPEDGTGVFGNDVTSFEKKKSRVIANPLKYFVNNHDRYGGGLVSTAWNRLYRKRAITGCSFPRGVQPGEDSFFNFQVFDRLKSLAVLPVVLYGFRSNLRSVSHGDALKLVMKNLHGREVISRYWNKSKSANAKNFMRLAGDETYDMVKFSMNNCDDDELLKVKAEFRRLIEEGVLSKSILSRSHLSKVEAFLDGGNKIRGLKPILVHAHIFYPALWVELKACINNISPYKFDLFVTMVEEHRDIASDVRASFPHAKIEIVPNRGYDVAPFVKVLNGVDLDRYSYIVKLHTKRDLPFDFRLNGFSYYGAKLRKRMLSFVSKWESFRQVIDAFERDPKLGMVADYHLIVEEDTYDPVAAARAREMIQRMGLNLPSPMFVAGTMFIARAALFKPLISLGIVDEDFDVAGTDHQTQFAHVVERLAGYVVGAQGFEVKDVFSQMKLNGCLAESMRKVFLIKRTRKGRILIKFFGLPVWNGKLKSKA